MCPTNGFDDLIGQDVPRGNDGDLPGFAGPVTRTEIEELLYGDAPPKERLERLSALRGEIARLESPDYGEDDPASLMGEIDDAIARLSVETGREVELSGDVMDAPLLPDTDALDHRETLSPDSDEMDLIRARDEEDLDDEEEELEEEDELRALDEADDPDDLSRPLDEEEWEEGR